EWHDGCVPTEHVFAALAAPQRQQILRLVRDEPLTVGAIAEGCGASQQAVSHHLQILKDAGLVNMQREGRRHLYVVNPDGFDSVGSFVADLWPKGLDKLRSVLEDTEK
ncbi:MAG: metalloregulator ArsR/SmtB family transcription factor, partial [Ilumatobacteraceae bacterium]|nr:metalloregulator ArsR/SmtB family transcription factor [Ilumatobacteraceae bacterium]